MRTNIISSWFNFTTHIPENKACNATLLTTGIDIIVELSAAALDMVVLYAAIGIIPYILWQAEFFIESRFANFMSKSCYCRNKLYICLRICFKGSNIII